MKQLVWILALWMMAAPAWAAKKITVQQLKDMLISLQQERKTDEEVARELKQVVLAEELSRSAMNSMVDYVPGKLSTEQIYVLEARSAMLAPPASDLPSTPAPDAAAQKALLDKASNYVANVYAQLPNLTASKTTVRFQDNVEAALGSSGLHSGALGDASADPNLVAASQFIHYINSTDYTVEMHNGVEENPLANDKTRWGANRMIALLGPEPSLANILAEAQSAGKISWLRWETVNGKTAAVYAFSVDKKKSHYAVNYCCFPDLDQAGVINYSQPKSAGSIGDHTARGNFQTATSWKNFKAIVPYHGEVFVDPDSGIVVRLIAEAEFKTSDSVHQEDERIDYGPVTVGDKLLVLPVRSIVNTEVVPNGDSGAGKYELRRTLFTSENTNYAMR